MLNTSHTHTHMHIHIIYSVVKFIHILAKKKKKTLDPEIGFRTKKNSPDTKHAEHATILIIIIIIIIII